ncbi:acyl-peptide hydrolase [Prauserella marina]|uniref:Dipeptidyl aminopeptidase/acylaminoacyl peptidase n=1 Tax=Prauserella marina TaxID=530584 RepID=A0A222VQG9_9PSEU|nr:prolyl oligopeptidase family serine peptidase [Prauserella marina]ASR36165.1 acyl-peptide hydrolase [Prauserella marina]PWV76914.1 dipeptidyl aminopeptidase/acylaminoacyl peptidase [Prauserella marina]SDD00284.1 Dipeptidyl aminopeptidase/acylaminoacyl peptidase [Prauserella marina]
MPEIAPFGSWTSPIAAADVATAGVTPQWLDVVAGEVWWAEARPAEAGRVAVVRSTGEGIEEVLPAPWSARNRVHEYGGRPWLATATSLVFTNWDDQRGYVRDLATGTTVPCTPEPPAPQSIRYGDLRRGKGSQVWAVRERETGPQRTDVARDLVAISPEGGEPRVLAASHHFLTAPQLSPGGTHAAWLGWNHPAMPWDGTELCVAEVRDDGSFGPHRVLAGGPDVAVCQLDWEDEEHLLALLDPNGWWNPHRISLSGELTNLAEARAELGGALWKIGSRWMVPLGERRHAVIDAGKLAVLDETTGSLEHVATELTAWSPSIAVAGDGGIVGIAAGPRRETAVVHVDLSDGAITELTAQPGLPDPGYLSVPEQRVFHDAEGEPVPAYVYPPANPDFRAPEGDLPPYVVHAHGGPTGRNYPVLDLDFSYLTSRGIGVVAVDYGGSTGYGRRFRQRLREQWGVVDVGDCAAVAEALVAEGIADPDRLAIRGGSAGGFTSAASMTTVRTYRAATIKFPILDLEPWTGAGGETHDFESRYLEGLIGALPGTAKRWVERSPITNIGDLAGPVLLLQGLEDEICPPEQAQRFVDSLAGSGIAHAHLTFEGEQHGFRKASTIVAALEAELAFYGAVFGFPTPGVPSLDLSR